MNDTASTITMAYYELNEFDRPQSKADFMKFAFKTSARFLNTRLKIYSSEGMTGKLSDPESEGKLSGVVAAERLSWARRKENPDQITHVHAMQTLALLDGLPMNLRRMAYKMIDGADLVDSASEMETDLVSAMRDQKAIRCLARWLADDERDEKRRAANLGTVGSHAQDRAQERHGLKLTIEDFKEMTAAIKSGRAILLADDGPDGRDYLVPFKDKTLPVIYNPLDDTIVSVLPPQCKQVTDYLKFGAAR